MPLGSCDALLIISVIALGISTVAAAPQPKYRPPAVYTSMRVTDIGNCAVKVNEEGAYQLSGQTQPSRTQLPPYCTVKLVAPVGYRVEIVFDDSGEFVCRPPSFIAVLNGWNVVDSLRRSVKFIPESISSTPDVVCGRVAGDDVDPPRFVSSTNLAEIVYALQNKESAVFSVKFVKEKLTCGEYITMDHIGREITLTNNGRPGRCQVFLPGGSIVHIDSVKLTTNPDADGKCVDGSYFQLKTGNSVFFLPLVSEKICAAQKDDLHSTISLPCKRAIAELVSTSFEFEEVKIRFTLAPHADAVLDSVICPA